MFKFSLKGVPVLEFIVIVFAFLFVDLFDTLGTLIGVSAKADMLDSREDSADQGRAPCRRGRYDLRCLPRYIHSHNICGERFRRDRGRKNRSYILDDRYPVPVILVLISDLPCNPVLCDGSGPDRCRLLHDRLRIGDRF